MTANPNANPTATTTPASRLLTGLAVGAFAVAAIAGDATFNATPASAAIKIKDLKIKHRDRGRPILTVRLINGKWQSKSSDRVRFSLKVEIKSKKNRMRNVWMEMAGRKHHAWRGKAWKLRWKKFTMSFGSNALGKQSTGAAKACGNLMKNRTGHHRFKHKIKIVFHVADKKNRKAASARYVSAFLDCRR